MKYCWSTIIQSLTTNRDCKLTQDFSNFVNTGNVQDPDLHNRAMPGTAWYNRSKSTRDAFCTIYTAIKFNSKTIPDRRNLLYYYQQPLLQSSKKSMKIRGKIKIAYTFQICKISICLPFSIKKNCTFSLLTHK